MGANALIKLKLTTFKIKFRGKIEVIMNSLERNIKLIIKHK